eukprot:gene2620-3012_t
MTTDTDSVPMETVDMPVKAEKQKKQAREVKGYGGQESPEEYANPISRICFAWADKFVWFCFRNVLELRHIWDLASYDRAESLTRRIGVQWEIEMKKEKPSYTSAAMRAFGPYFMISWIFFGIYAASQFVGPELLSRMVAFVLDSRTAQKDDPNMGYYYAVALFGSSMIGSFCLYQANMISARVGDYMRSVIVCDVYRKSLKLSNSARAKTSPGEIVNLMSNDAQRMVEVFLLVNNGVFAPAQIIVCLVLLYRQIGWPTFVGLGFMLFMVPLNGFAAKKLTEVRRMMIRFTDARVKTTNEILQAIKIIKLYAWEDSFAQRVAQRRGAEVKLLYTFSYIRAGLIFIVASVPTLVSVLVFASYYGYHKELQAGKIFSSLAYLNILRMPLGFLPIILALIVQLKIATNRITDFLLLPEMIPLSEPEDPNRPAGVYIESAKFAWLTKQDKADERAHDKKMAAPVKKQKKSARPVVAAAPVAAKSEEELAADATAADKMDRGFELSDITLTCTGPSLTMVVGAVGSGKSSICQAMLGEMTTLEGSVSARGRIAYVAQQAWIINASLRDNIVFGSEFDEDRYYNVLEVCALERDIELFPQGDLVEIGERGVNLSGGQKQRVSIARAVYNNADIYILDDPLSAVDAHVGKHLFHKCFNGLLKNKTVILAANQLNYLPYADHVIVMRGGSIVEKGTYNELVSAKGDYAKLLEDYGIEDVHTPTQADEEVSEEKTKPKERPVLRNNDGILIQQEERETGSVSLKVYLKYFQSGGSLLFVFTFILFLLDIGSRTVTDWWLSHWSNSAANSSMSATTYLWIYIGIGLASVIASGARNFVYFGFTVKAGEVLHNQLFASLLRAPMWFFDTTPLGRIINRFTRDQDGVDNLIAAALSQYLVFFLTVIATLIIISIITPFLLIPLAPIIVLYYLLQTFYRHTSRELQRLESISRSPIFAHFTETLNGVSTIRAYRTQEVNILANQFKLDQNNKTYLTLQAMNQWLGLRLDLLGNLIIFFAALFITIDKTTISLANVGLSLSYSLSITANLNRATLQAADTETKMNSVERIWHYINGPIEAKQIVEEHRPAADWPPHGAITFDNLVMRYREGLDPVLKGISCQIASKEKIGIVGRTGAGKSSIVLALFRLIEASEGAILIDGENIAKFGLKDLRRNLAIIPQDPVLFSGTMRDNLDPFNESNDDDLWRLLEDIQLSQVVRELEGGLLCKVAEEGSNFSVGQRQLIALGRALLRKPKILVLDEATASVDSHTDSLIQSTIREKFANATILTIAHRLNTIMDSDRIMVLDAGRIAEFDTPNNLLQNPSGLLSWLVDETGPQNAIYLKKMARESAFGPVSSSAKEPKIASKDLNANFKN